MVGVIDGCRWALLRGQVDINWTGVGLSFTVVLLSLWGGLQLFRRLEGNFADRI